MDPKTAIVLFYGSYLLVAGLVGFIMRKQYGFSWSVSLLAILVAILVCYALFAWYFNWQARRERAYEARFTRRTA